MPMGTPLTHRLEFALYAEVTTFPPSEPRKMWDALCSCGRWGMVGATQREGREGWKQHCKTDPYAQ